jgi:hypothetical protein
MINCIVEKLTDDAIFIDKNAWLYIAACSVHQNEVREHYIHILHSKDKKVMVWTSFAEKKRKKQKKRKRKKQKQRKRKKQKRKKKSD